MKKRILSVVLCLATLWVTVTFSGCSKKPGEGGSGTTTPDAFVIMTEQLEGLFNPFFSTSANDGTIVSMTQIGMITTGYEGGEVTVAYGDNEAVFIPIRIRLKSVL